MKILRKYFQYLINFELEKIDFKKEDLLEKICNEINQLREKYEKVEEENIKLKAEIEDMKNKYEELNKELIIKERYPLFDNKTQYDFIIKTSSVKIIKSCLTFR